MTTQQQDVTSVIDRYRAVRAEREARARAFHEGERPFMIFQFPWADIWGDVRTPADCFEQNIAWIARSLETPSDHLPAMEPWFGTGVYANMYGCPYVWREGQAPAVHYRYHSIDEVRDLPAPRWEDSEIAQLVMETIRYFKSKTGDAIPIVWTDTQSAGDNATLILDATEVLLNCLVEPEVTIAFMRNINERIIEFSRAQAELIGDALVQPGHILFSNVGFGGISVSDDNLAVCSPAVNGNFNLVLDEELGQAFGGVAIHSCGRWDHTMGLIKEVCPSCTAIDCAIDGTQDPNPNDPEVVRDAMAGSGIVVNVRMTGETDEMLEVVKRVIHPDLKLVVHPSYIDPATAERNYAELQALLGA